MFVVVQNSTLKQVISETNKTHTDAICNYRHAGVQVAESVMIKGQESLRAMDFIPADTVIFIFENSVSDVRTRTSIQVSSKYHIEAGDFGSFTNHSCSPNAIIVSECDENNMIAKVMLVTIANINSGDEIHFDYATTESTLTSDLLFKSCLCGSSKCRNVLTGYQELSENHKEKLRVKGLVSKFLL